MDYYHWKPYVPVALRRQQAARELAALTRKGQRAAPVVIDGQVIAKTFWGKAWCDNLECYSDYVNRLPRGRTYVRNGSVLDLQIAPGVVSAMVSGSELYRVQVTVAPVAKTCWHAVCQDCAGAIDSLVALLRGQLSESVMARICRKQTGLFPSPTEMTFSCSCPDWASMCKHVAAVLYGIGARLDAKPDLLFALRRVNQRDLIATAGRDLSRTATAPGAGRVLDGGDLSELFGIEIAEGVPPVPARARSKAHPTMARRQTGKPPERARTAHHSDDSAAPPAVPRRPSKRSK